MGTRFSQSPALPPFLSFNATAPKAIDLSRANEKIDSQTKEKLSKLLRFLSKDDLSMRSR